MTPALQQDLFAAYRTLATALAAAATAGDFVEARILENPLWSLGQALDQLKVTLDPAPVERP